MQELLDYVKEREAEFDKAFMLGSEGCLGGYDCEFDLSKIKAFHTQTIQGVLERVERIVSEEKMKFEFFCEEGGSVAMWSILQELQQVKEQLSTKPTTGQ